MWSSLPSPGGSRASTISVLCFLSVNVHVCPPRLSEGNRSYQLNLLQHKVLRKVSFACLRSTFHADESFLCANVTGAGGHRRFLISLHITGIALQHETNEPRELYVVIMSVPQAREASSSLQLCR